MEERASNIMSSLPRTPQSGDPWLMFSGPEVNVDPKTRFFCSLADKQIYKIKDVFEDIVDAWCVGSSHGWLVLLDDKGNPQLFNPFTRARIELPPFPSEIKPIIDDDYFVEDLRKSFICKAVLLFCGEDEEDQYSSKNCTVVISYGWKPKLAFCIRGSHTWISLAGSGTDEGYCDILCHGHELYALTESGSVDVWDFRGILPRKVVNYRPCASLIRADNINFPRDKFSTKCYLVESSGDLLLVNRVIGNYVNSEGIVIDRDELIRSVYTCGYEYRTKQFSVYKLDCIENTWEKVESLPNRVIFLGGNQSISLSTKDHQGLKSNSIYYTDDNWDEMLDNDGGHDMGMFNLADGIPETLSLDSVNSIYPPSFWIIPIARHDAEEP